MVIWLEAMAAGVPIILPQKQNHTEQLKCTLKISTHPKHKHALKKL